MSQKQRAGQCELGGNDRRWVRDVGEGWGGSKPDQRELCRLVTDFGFCSDFCLKGFFLAAGWRNEYHTRVEAGREDCSEGIAVI